MKLSVCLSASFSLSLFFPPFHPALLTRSTPLPLSSYLPMDMVDHNIVWLDVSMHYAHAVAVVQSSEQLVQIVANVIVGELLVESLEGGTAGGREGREGGRGKEEGSERREEGEERKGGMKEGRRERRK